MKNILVPFDFSRPSINAFRFALDIAAQSNAKVHLLNGFELTKKAKDKFGELISRYDTGAVDIVTRNEVGDMPPAVYQFIKKASIDIIIMGSHSTAGMRETFIGSNAEKIVRHSPVPVLIVKDCHRGPVKNIILPVDLATSEQGDFVAKIKALQNFFKAHLHLLGVDPAGHGASDAIASSALQAFAAQHDLSDYTVNVFHHKNENQGIQLFAHAVQGNLIAMGAQSRQRILQLINGDAGDTMQGQHLIWSYPFGSERAAS